MARNGGSCGEIRPPVVNFSPATTESSAVVRRYLHGFRRRRMDDALERRGRMSSVATRHPFGAGRPGDSTPTRARRSSSARSMPSARTRAPSSAARPNEGGKMPSTRSLPTASRLRSTCAVFDPRHGGRERRRLLLDAILDALALERQRHLRAVRRDLTREVTGVLAALENGTAVVRARRAAAAAKRRALLLRTSRGAGDRKDDDDGGENGDEGRSQSTIVSKRTTAKEWLLAFICTLVVRAASTNASSSHVTRGAMGEARARRPSRRERRGLQRLGTEIRPATTSARSISTFLFTSSGMPAA